MATAIAHLYKDNDVYEIVKAIHRLNLGIYYTDFVKDETPFSYDDNRMSEETNEQFYFLDNNLDYLTERETDERKNNGDWDKDVNQLYLDGREL